MPEAPVAEPAAREPTTSTAAPPDALQLRARVIALETRLDEALALNARIEAQHHADSDLVGKLLARVAEVDEIVAGAEKKRREANERVMSADARVAELTARLDSAMRDASDAKSRENDAVSGEKKATARYESAFAELREQTEEWVDLHVSAEAMKTRIGELETQLEGAVEALAASKRYATAQLTDATEAHAHALAERDAMHARAIESLKLNVAAAEEVARECDRRSESLRRELDDAHARERAAVARHDRSNAAVRAWVERLDETVHAMAKAVGAPGGR